MYYSKIPLLRPLKNKTGPLLRHIYTHVVPNSWFPCNWVILYNLLLSPLYVVPQGWSD